MMFTDTNDNSYLKSKHEMQINNTKHHLEKGLVRENYQQHECSLPWATDYFLNFVPESARWKTKKIHISTQNEYFSSGESLTPFSGPWLGVKHGLTSAL